MSNNDIELDYDFLTENAMRGVMKDVLSIAAELGDVPGEHHFYIEFLTQADGVEISKDLIAAYPNRMMIVLQHKFENLIVGDEHFEVTLHFQGDAERLVIPFEAITDFVDPSCSFRLSFGGGADLFEDQPQQPDAEAEENEPTEEADESASSEATEESGSEAETTEEENEGGADVVSLDAFRKK